MGADIHAFLEYSKDGSDYWDSMTNNYGSRDYTWFSIIAGVRGRDYQLFEPKGLPEGKLSYEANNAYYLHIAPDNRPEWADSEGWTTRERAENWIANKYSLPEYDDNGILKRVTNPDCHSTSWLTADELEHAINFYVDIAQQNNWGYSHRPDQWIPVLAAMRSFESMKYKTRLLFWFDN